MSSSEILVRLEGITKKYGELVAVKDLSLDLRRGEMLGLIGPDGAGKTTTLRVVLGLLRPEAGRALTCGLAPGRQRRELSRRVGYLSQRFSLYGDLSVDENVAFFAQIHGVEEWQPLREQLLEIVRLTPFRKRLAHRLSGGMKQKLALACTLVHTPELLVLDEPTTGVDPVSRRDFWKLLARLQRDGLTLLLTTPYLDEAERCGRVALLDRGRLLVVDTPDALRAGAAGTLIELLASPRHAVIERLRAQPEVSDVEVFGERLHVTLPRVAPGAAAAAAASLGSLLRAAGIDVQLARPAPPSLEDVYISRIRAAEAGYASSVPTGEGGAARRETSP